MRDFVSCFSQYAVQISDNASCSSQSTTSCVPPATTTTTSAAAAVPSVQIAATSLYRSILSDHRQLSISVTWSKSTSSSSSHTLTIAFDDEPTPSFRLAINASSRLFKKLKGAKSFNLHSSKVEVFWDLSSAQYGQGPEPIDGDYHLAVSVDSEPVLTLGDPTQEPPENSNLNPKFALVSRQEHFLGFAQYSTRARFRGEGEEHQISIGCNGGSAMTVSIDEKVVIFVKRLQWNFRGNQTIFLDGLLVDMMWDLHDWFDFGKNSCDGLGSYGVFMFKTRSGLDSRLWLDEEDKNDRDCLGNSKLEFSLMIYACKNS